MILIVGLGNSGKEYEKTRHNVGFEILDRISAKCKMFTPPISGGARNAKQQLKTQNFRLEKKFNSEILLGEFEGEKVILSKPQTFMNNSGEAVGKIVDYYKINLDDIWVVCDDLNLKLGQIRVRKSGSDGGHNGLKSIIQHLGTKDFVRFRVGIGSNRKANSQKPTANSISAEKYVLQKFPSDEKEIINKVIDKTSQLIVLSISNGVKEETVECE